VKGDGPITDMTSQLSSHRAHSFNGAGYNRLMGEAVVLESSHTHNSNQSSQDNEFCVADRSYSLPCPEFFLPNGREDKGTGAYMRNHAIADVKLNDRKRTSRFVVIFSDVL
jgi:hypothetical protein